jgi:His/Glu/Gln/Arg/opine family amino acid ABC transporter permease subunit
VGTFFLPKASSMFEQLLQNLGLSAFSLKGFGPLLMQGTWMTIKLSALSLLLSVLLGLLGASAKLSSVKLLRIPAQLYTTLIRGVPDLVLMLLIFYSLQTWLTSFTDFMEWEYIEINPFGAGVITLGSFMARISPKPFAARSSPCRAGRLKRPRPMASSVASVSATWCSRK